MIYKIAGDSNVWYLHWRKASYLKCSTVAAVVGENKNLTVPQVSHGIKERKY
jgi:hypothetical protein